MSVLAPTIEKQQHRSGQIGADRRKLGHRSVVCDLVEKRIAWTLRITDLEREYSEAVAAIRRIEAQIKEEWHEQESRAT